MVELARVGAMQRGKHTEIRVSAPRRETEGLCGVNIGFECAHGGAMKVYRRTSSMSRSLLGVEVSMTREQRVPDLGKTREGG